MAEAPANPLEHARRVLSLVGERDMDGYALLSKSGLTLNEIEAAIQLLLERKVLRVKGETRGPRLVESWFQAVPSNWQANAAL